MKTRQDTFDGDGCGESWGVTLSSSHAHGWTTTSGERRAVSSSQMFLTEPEQRTMQRLTAFLATEGVTHDDLKKLLGIVARGRADGGR